MCIWLSSSCLKKGAFVPTSLWILLARKADQRPIVRIIEFWCLCSFQIRDAKISRFLHAHLFHQKETAEIWFSVKRFVPFWIIPILLRIICIYFFAQWATFWLSSIFEKVFLLPPLVKDGTFEQKLHFYCLLHT